jgi:hypothetical protein
MTDTKQQILDRIKRLERELNKEVAKIEADGKQVVTKYNKKTNKDELFIEGKQS